MKQTTKDGWYIIQPNRHSERTYAVYEGPDPAIGVEAGGFECLNDKGGAMPVGKPHSWSGPFEPNHVAKIEPETIKALAEGRMVAVERDDVADWREAAIAAKWRQDDYNPGGSTNAWLGVSIECMNGVLGDESMGAWGCDD